eukprot:953377-Rhodomonas_salina.3
MTTSMTKPPERTRNSSVIAPGRRLTAPCQHQPEKVSSHPAIQLDCGRGRGTRTTKRGRACAKELGRRHQHKGAAAVPAISYPKHLEEIACGGFPWREGSSQIRNQPGRPIRTAGLDCHNLARLPELELVRVPTSENMARQVAHCSRRQPRAKLTSPALSARP